MPLRGEGGERVSLGHSQVGLRRPEDVKQEKNGHKLDAKEVEDLMDQCSWGGNRREGKDSESWVDEGDESCCPICLDDLGPNEVRPEEVVELPGCRHLFHKNCMKKLLLLNKTKYNRCPLCQNDVAKAFRESRRMVLDVDHRSSNEVGSDGNDRVDGSSSQVTDRMGPSSVLALAHSEHFIFSKPVVGLRGCCG